MSRTYSIGCRQCRKHIWIAQASGDSTTLYTGEPHTMAALKAFLFDHLGHPLVFNENCESELADWDEMEVRSVRSSDGFSFLQPTKNMKHLEWSEKQPMQAGLFYWVARKGEKTMRIAEVVPCDALDKAPAGALKLSFPRSEEATRLDDFIYAGPIHPPSPLS